jgi:O-acetylhomoserine (thiol)-lyase
LTPVAQVSAFAQPSAEHMERVFRSQTPGYAYTRLGNPTIAAFEQRVARLEGGLGAVACASGMAAVSMALLNILQTGDEIVATSRLYGGTLSLFHDLEHFGIHTRFSLGWDTDSIRAQITPRTRVIFTEVISNPGLNVVDVAAVAQLAHNHNLPLIVDATTATPVLLRPLSLGADVVVHSSSKYINGSGSAISGIIVDGGKFKWNGDRWPVLKPYTKLPQLAYTQRLRQDIWQNFGPCLSPQNAFLNTVGLETIGLRVERACANALKLAQALEENPLVYGVNYPGLPSSSSHQLAMAQLADNMGGALLTFRAGSKQKAFAILNNLNYAFIVSNIGDSRTLVVHPASSIYIHSSQKEMEEAGVYEDLIRVSVGIEDAQDLIADFTQAIQAAQQVS